MINITDVVLLGFLVATAIAILRARDLFVVGVLSGIFSLTSAGLFVVMDAVDVAFTEASVGAGITTVLFLGAISLTVRHEKQDARKHFLPLAMVLIVGFALLLGTRDMPLFGDPNAPIHSHVAPRYIEKSAEEIGHIPNVVTSVLTSYRGYDTLGETTVIFTAGIGALLLLGGGLRRRRRKKEDESE